ncbi:MAG: carbohydrate ABC transporter permease [Kiritimatiellia bacterium]
MGLIAKTGRKSWKVRLLLFSIFAALSLGALSMAVPFLLMLSGSTRSGVDLQEFSLLPEFLYQEERLYQKYIEALYNESPSNLRASWGSELRDFSQVRLRENPDLESVKAWEAFVSENQIPAHELSAGFVYTPVSRSRPWLVRRFMQQLQKEFEGAVEALNQAMGTGFKDWNAFQMLPVDTRSRQGYQQPTPFELRWREFLREEAPAWSRGVYHLDGYYHERVTRVLSGRAAEAVALSASAPEDSANRELFVREVVHPGYVRMDPVFQPLWQELLLARYGDLDSLRKVTGLNVRDGSELVLPATVQEAGPLAADWMALLEGWQHPETRRKIRIPLEGLRLESLDLRWRLETGTAPPMQDRDQWMFQTHKAEIRRVFLFQNYGAVWEILILNGRGLWVTVLYCAGSVLIALVVNPMAAYALSRFRPRHSYAFLLYLLLTMAFPPMVTQIPLFLLLRDLQLLNTFWALLLPGMAHGYSIFLLKGFFDSLPRELYESASLDGAGELLMFRVITLSLSKPILAVIALSAFVNAYTAFMFALLICQDERMWTLMVWLYQLQQNYGPGVMNAAFVLASLPTLLVFLLAQRQILRGIVVPSEKG